MSSESCSSSPQLDYNRLLNGITFINLDYPDANNAMLEGIRNGMVGYQMDKIILSRSQKKDFCNPASNLPSYENKQTEDAVPDVKMPERKNKNDLIDFEEIEDILVPARNMSLSNPGSGHIDAQPVKQKSVQTLPKSIGEERKEWILEAHRACRLSEPQDSRFTKSVPAQLNKYSNQIHQRSSSSSCSRQVIETTSVSCPDLEAKREATLGLHNCEQEDNSSPPSTEIHDENQISSASPDENESCELLFARRDVGGSRQSEIRLSPRMERFDKLIPRTSKEFLNTMRIVSEISPQASEEQLHSISGSSNPSSSEVVQDTKPVNNDVNLYHHDHHSDDSDEPDRIHIDSDHHHQQHQPSLSSDADAVSGNRLAGLVCRSYKEVCIYGPNSSSGAHSSSLPPDQIPDKALNENNNRTNNSQSTCGFPRLQTLSGTGMLGEDGPRVAPPLYSSILQRSPTACNYGCGDINCADFHQHVILQQQPKAKGKVSPVSTATLPLSPPSPLGSFDCGFCRTNNEPENVYRSHPLRLNDIVVCPSLRKYVCCFCGATGDKAHTIKYCPKNPIGFFAKKTRNSPVPPLSQPITEKIANNSNISNIKCVSTCPEKIINHQPEIVPAAVAVAKTKENKNGHAHAIKELNSPFEQEVKSDSESNAVVNDDLCVEPMKRTSGNWIEAKTKGRKKKNGK